MSFPFPISPSQITAYTDCKRLYAWAYCVNAEQESNEAAKIGTAMHNQLEEWFKCGNTPDDTLPGLMAQELLTKWPAPHDGMVIEEHVEVMTEYAWYHGKKDIGYEQVFENNKSKKKIRLRVVGDHKSTSDLQWAKTKAELIKDPQGIIYSAAEMSDHNVDEVIQRWAYVTRSKKPKSKVVEQIITREQVEAGFDILDPLAVEIYALRATDNINPLDLPPSIERCSAKGGCSFKKLCTDLTPAKRMLALMKQMTLREKILAKQAEKSGGALSEDLKPAEKASPKTVEAKVAPKAEPKVEAATKPLSLKEKMAAKQAEKTTTDKTTEPATFDAPTKAAKKPAVVKTKQPEPEPEPVEDDELPDELPSDDEDLVEAETEALLDGIRPNNAPGYKHDSGLTRGLYYRVRFSSGYEGLFGPIADNIQEPVFISLVQRANVDSVTHMLIE